MINKNIFLVCLALLLSACSSAPKKETNYYLLNTHVVNDISQNRALNNLAVDDVLIKVRLPEYLMQPNLVIQMGKHRLHYARYHLWAENLQPAITKALVAEMKKIMLEKSSIDSSINRSSYNFVERAQGRQGQKSFTLQIDHFYPNDRSQVIMSGKFWVTGFNHRNASQSQQFHFEQTLQNDGYPHAVLQMRGLVSRLAEYLVEQQL